MAADRRQGEVVRNCHCCDRDPWDWVTAAPANMRISLLDRLRMRGFDVPAPGSLSDVGLSSMLWELLDELKRLRVYLSHTDHLSDRALYTLLWEEFLPEPLFLEGFAFGGRLHFDILGAWSDLEVELFLQHYASEEERTTWLEMFPGDRVPPPRPPAYDRDRWLPRPEQGGKEGSE